MTQQDKIIDKIRKLLALSDETRAGTPEEAASAAAKVQELLERYNLDRAAIEGQPGKVSMVMSSLKLPTSRLWAKKLLDVLARYNFCKAVWGSGTDQGYLLGDSTNIEAVIILYEHLSSALVAMLPVYYKAHCREAAKLRERVYYWQPEHINTYRTNFLSGAVDAVHYRLDEEQKQFMQEHNTNRALIVSNGAELQEFQDQVLPETRNVKMPKRDGIGYKAGIKAGLIVDITPHKLVSEAQ